MENKVNLVIDRANRAIVITRVFDAPRELVFRVMTDPKLVPQWWGPRNLTTLVDKMDLRPGGLWRFVQHDSAGAEYAFNGEYREIVPPERVVSTFEFEPLKGHIVLETVILEDLNGKTKMVTRDVYQSLEDLEGMVQSGMEGGVRESYERLDEQLELQRIRR